MTLSFKQQEIIELPVWFFSIARNAKTLFFYSRQNVKADQVPTTLKCIHHCKESCTKLLNAASHYWYGIKFTKNTAVEPQRTPMSPLVHSIGPPCIFQNYFLLYYDLRKQFLTEVTPEYNTKFLFLSQNAFKSLHCLLGSAQMQKSRLQKLSE